MADNQQADKPRVYVAAFFCQDIIRERDNDFLTAVRIAESFAAVPVEITPVFQGEGQLPEVPAIRVYPPLDAHAVVMFRSEQPIEFTCSMRGVMPDGELWPGGFQDLKCRIGADGAGYTLNLSIRIPTDREGTFWFEIYVEGELATKLPLRIAHPEMTFGTGQQVVKLMAPIPEEAC